MRSTASSCSDASTRSRSPAARSTSSPRATTPTPAASSKSAHVRRRRQRHRSFNGNRVPEVPWHVAALTLGVEGTTGWRWNASVTWTYRGSFFTDAANTPYGGRGGMRRTGGRDARSRRPARRARCRASGCCRPASTSTSATPAPACSSSGDNLLDELYITDREDGMKPGLGRTIWTGFKYKF